jgi:hypothetical protein
MLDTQKSTIGHNSGHMTEAEYDLERAKIAPTKKVAGTRWEQELARLFSRSGWTHERLAKREGYGRATISRLLVFGEFLAFSANVKPLTNAGNWLDGLTAERFHTYWRRTGAGTGHRASTLHHRERFLRVVRMMEAECHEWVKQGRHRKYPPLPPDTTANIIKKCGDGKWRSPAQIASKAGLDPENVGRVVHLVQHHKHLAKTESKKVGKEIHYRIFKQDKTVSIDELTEKLAPIIKGLEVEGKKHSAQRVEAEIARLAALLKRLLNEWAE